MCLPLCPSLFPYTTLFRSIVFGLGFAYMLSGGGWETSFDKNVIPSDAAQWAIIGMAMGTLVGGAAQLLIQIPSLDRKSTRLNSSHLVISYAVFCLTTKKNK